MDSAPRSPRPFERCRYAHRSSLSMELDLARPSMLITIAISVNGIRIKRRALADGLRKMW